jgi:hypothetical protein
MLVRYLNALYAFWVANPHFFQCFSYCKLALRVANPWGQLPAEQTFLAKKMCNPKNIFLFWLLSINDWIHETENETTLFIFSSSFQT